jgi:hypothetical protein
MDMLDELIEAMGKSIEEMRKWPVKKVQIFHHNDSDGFVNVRHGQHSHRQREWT